MRILILSYSYPPMVNARALRWSSLAEYWVAQGHEVRVIAAWQPGALEVEDLNGVPVARTAWRWTQRLRGAVASERTAEVRANERRGAWQPWLHKAWRSVYWPDTSCLWLPAALAAGRRAARQAHPDAVISVSPTFSAVVAGMRLMGRLHPRPRWLLDLGDPFSFAEEPPPNNVRLYRALNVAAERSAFRRADKIAVTTQETSARYADLFPESAGKIEVIPHLVSVDGMAPARPCGEVLSLVYVGTLSRAMRNPQFMTALLERLLRRPFGRRLELHVYGDVQDSRAAFQAHPELLGCSLFVHGTVPHAAAVEIMRNATVLVNIGNRTPYQLPSKLVDYVALGKPILNLAGTAQDSSRRFLATYPGHLSLDAWQGEPTEAQLRACEEFLQSVILGRLPAAGENLAAAHRIEVISRRYLGLLGA